MTLRSATAIAAAMAAAGAAAAGPAAGATPSSHDVLVAMAAGSGTAAVAAAGASHPRLVSRPLRAFLVRAPGGVGAGRFARRLARLPGVVAAQPDFVMREAAPTLACVQPPPSPTGYFVSAVRADQVTPPATTPPVAVLDSGVDGSLPELAGRIVSPFNAISGGTDVTDGDGHGTGVAGVAAAAPGGVRGISPTSPIAPIRVFDGEGATTASTLVKAIDAAVAAHAGVINISAAGSAADTSAAEDTVLVMAIDRAFTAGTLVVAPTGNEGGTDLDLPSAYPHVLSVAATDASDQVASFSNGGPSVDLAAPGVDITSTAPAALCSTHFALDSGTSFASPAVAGAVALVKGARPSLSASQVFSLMRTSARDIGPRGFDSSSGFGVLDVAAALTAGAPAPDSREIDDDVLWVTGRYAKAHPFALTPSRRRARLSGQVNAFNDPADVYRMKLRMGDRLSMKMTAPSGSRWALSVWNSHTRGFDITNGRERGRLVAAADRRGARESLGVRVKRGGVYYLAVSAPRADAATGSYLLTVRRKAS